jgi:REP-associated tyrosine transposase
MPSYRGPRVRINPETFAITVVTHQRRRIFQRTTTAKLMIDTLFRYSDQSRFALHGFVVMPDHLHALLTPSSDQTIERYVQLIKGGFSFAIRNDFKGDLWQDGYHAHRLTDSSDYQNQLQYIANNPKRKNYPDYPHVHTTYENRLDAIPKHLKIELPCS